MPLHRLLSRQAGAALDSTDVQDSLGYPAEGQGRRLVEGRGCVLRLPGDISSPAGPPAAPPTARAWPALADAGPVWPADAAASRWHSFAGTLAGASTGARLHVPDACTPSRLDAVLMQGRGAAASCSHGTCSSILTVRTGRMQADHEPQPAHGTQSRAAGAAPAGAWAERGRLLPKLGPLSPSPVQLPACQHVKYQEMSVCTVDTRGTCSDSSQLCSVMQVGCRHRTKRRAQPGRTASCDHC